MKQGTFSLLRCALGAWLLSAIAGSSTGCWGFEPLGVATDTMIGTEASSAPDTEPGTDTQGTGSEVAGTDTESTSEPADTSEDTETFTYPETDNIVDTNGCADGWVGSDCALCVRYVVAGGTSVGNGLHWSTAFARVQDGIDAAYSYGLRHPDTPECAVWVGQGVYYIYEASADDTVQLRPHTTLTGGFTGNETEPWETTPPGVTTLDGRLSAESIEAVFHVVTSADDALLRGLRIQRGLALGVNERDRKGAGLLVEGGGMRIESCVFATNFAGLAGAGIASSGSSLTLQDSHFEANVSLFEAGGLGISGGSLTAVGCTFYFNEAREGGGVRAVDATLGLDRCYFSFNRATGDDGGAMLATGGTLVMTGSQFMDNATAASGGAIAVEDVTTCSVREVDFKTNRAAVAGGAIASVDSMVALEMTQLGFNQAPRGAGLDVTGNGELSVENGVFYAELADEGSSAYTESPAHFVNCTFHDEKTASGDDLPLAGPGTLTVVNSIVWRADGVLSALPAPDIFDHCISYFEAAGTNLCGDPLFSEPMSGDFRLQPGSPAIDAANSALAPAADFDGNARVDDPASENRGDGPPWADIGAFERQIAETR